MIAFKHTFTIDEWKDLHPKMRQLLIWLDERWPLDVMVITRIDQPAQQGETGVHHSGPPRRFADLRTNNLGPSVPEGLELLINKHWKYGDGRHKVALYHGGSAMHMHLQISDATEGPVD